MMTKEQALAVPAHMPLGLNAAIEVWHLCDPYSRKENINDEVLDFGVEELRSIMEKHFPLFSVTNEHLVACLDMMEKAIQITGMTSCGCFNYAHMLDHIFDLEDLGKGETPH